MVKVKVGYGLEYQYSENGAWVCSKIVYTSSEAALDAMRVFLENNYNFGFHPAVRLVELLEDNVEVWDEKDVD